MARWLHALETQAALALAAGELPRGSDPAAVAFALNSLAIGTNCDYQLNGEPRALELGRAAMRSVLGCPSGASA
jgi:hypothetical protein